MTTARAQGPPAIYRRALQGAGAAATDSRGQEWCSAGAAPRAGTNRPFDSPHAGDTEL